MEHEPMPRKMSLGLEQHLSTQTPARVKSWHREYSAPHLMSLTPLLFVLKRAALRISSIRYPRRAHHGES
jgi:hypothetical protein